MQATCKQHASEKEVKKDNEEEKKMNTQNSKPKIKNLNTKRCMRSTYLVMMDTKM
jgi:hypothetical protein